MCTLLERLRERLYLFSSIYASPIPSCSRQTYEPIRDGKPHVAVHSWFSCCRGDIAGDAPGISINKSSSPTSPLRSSSPASTGRD